MNEPELNDLSLLVLADLGTASPPTTASAPSRSCSCRCEHDCCGHVRSYVSRVRRLKSGLYAIIESHYRNI